MHLTLIGIINFIGTLIFAAEAVRQLQKDGMNNSTPFCGCMLAAVTCLTDLINN